MGRTCRACGSREVLGFLSLGQLPTSSSLSLDQLSKTQRQRLDMGFCPRCGLVQRLGEPQETIEAPASFSTWRELTGLLGPKKRVLALEGMPLRLLRQLGQQGAQLLYLEPHPERSQAALAQGIPTERARFDREVAQRLGDFQADWVLAGHLLAYSHNPSRFLEALARVLAEGGQAVLELPYLPYLLEARRFTHFSYGQQNYFTLKTLRSLARPHGLEIRQVAPCGPLALRYHLGRGALFAQAGVYLESEERLGLDQTGYYLEFASQVAALREALLTLLAELRARGRRVAAYGANPESAALFNYAGLGPELVEFLVDPDPRQRGRYLAGVHIPIHPPHRLLENPPDYLLLLHEAPGETPAELAEYLEGGGRMVVALPYPHILRPGEGMLAEPA
ncbi:methyltransferase domain-containing protein [Meiothermus sp. QL-1]|uniref:class I SAM-dependent methyltransferase n=1 Tax=Meiothermus sp. QL-1 TaxID=2058095 RepID=UPI000E09FEA8|nr:class I SAM-dependent methyltransferase [Meiothermus sp. QL-1]RDI96193.1 methyltransferase domain-containing protein [Meiothermus sp. QL-1]